ncbi:aminodeoxychorismate/anthranilate synthase component II [Reichenbachiella sp. MALMAid0571]|uniref:anthranilate synthase component II n=1 Tax=Reichenbachiella sp. MALMAid0571 TaxID=3143939 RepID=UPI0032DE5D11
MKILVLDNYDSFTYNLVHILKELGYGAKLDVIRNDQMTVEEVESYDKILLSPGPGVPVDAGIMMELIRKYAPTKSILGVCLGHQAIGEVFGSSLYNMDDVLHGVTTDVMTQGNDAFFSNIPEKFKVCRYHSWAIRPDTIGADLKVTAVDPKGEIMAISHKEYNVKGVQFHPESILTEHGKIMMENWVKT